MNPSAASDSGHAAMTTFVATCDLAGQLRGRSRAVLTPDDRSKPGVGWVPANLAIDAFGHLVEPNEFGSTGDLRLSPAGIAMTIPAVGPIPAATIEMANQTHLDGKTWECCPRGFLESALDDLERESGVRVVAAFEHEFHLFESPDQPPFSFRALRDAEPFGSDLVSTLATAGLRPETWLAEYGSGQYEITLAPSPGLRAADSAVLLREAVRDLASRHHRRATFSPVVAPGAIGNGVHVHLSLVRADADQPVLFDPARPGGLSDIGAAFSAGILKHASAICAVSAPSPISYRRLLPHQWSSSGAYLASRDRESLLRICPVDLTDESAACAGYNLEFRAGDAAANPYLLLGTLVRAGLAGIKSKERAQVWTHDLTESDLRTIPSLPRSLPEALSALDSDHEAKSWFPPDLLSTYLSVKQSELEHVRDLDDAAACQRMTDVY